MPLNFKAASKAIRLHLSKEAASRAASRAAQRSVIADVRAATRAVCEQIGTMDIEELVRFGNAHVLTRQNRKFTQTTGKEWRAKNDLWDWWAARPDNEVDVADLTNESVYFAWCVRRLQVFAELAAE